jgi:hypothetical protein
MPSLDLRFAESKSLIDAVSGRQLVTFTRASSGTFVGSDGLIKTAAVNEPRFTHDPVTGESLGLLVEEQGTNLVVRSEEFETTWDASGLSARNSNQEVSPNGTLTADVIVETSDATAAVHAVLQSFSVDSGASYAASVYAKQGSRQGVTILLGAAGFGSNLSARFNLSTGAVAASSPGVTASITPAGNGFYRCVAVATATATAATFLQIRIATATTDFYLGNGTGSIALWGAQLEAGDFATSYIPTTTATATRSTDVASIRDGAFSSWYRQDEGTVFADFRGFPIRAGEFPRVVDFNDGGSSNFIRLQQYASNVVRASIGEGGVTQMAQDTGTIAQGVQGKAILAVAANACAVAVNGGVPVTDSSVTVPSGLTRLNILAPPSQTSVANSSIRRLTYWPHRLGDNTLQELTR